MSKAVLTIVGIVLVLMGIAALIPSWDWATEPVWHAWVKIVLGVIAMGVAIADNGEE